MENAELNELKKKLDEACKTSRRAKEDLESIAVSIRKILEKDSDKSEAIRIAEHQRLLDQYVYRDRLIVQEFYFSIVAVGIAVKFVTDPIHALLGIVISAAMFLLMAGLWVHIRHLRIDRDLMWV